MNSTDFERARTLLPSFLKKTISANDKAWMTQFIQNLQDKSLNLDEGKVRQFNDEMAWVELSQGQLDNTTPAFDSEAGWKKMAMQLEISPLAQPAQPSHPLQAPHDKKKRSAFDLMKLLINAKFGSLIELWRKPMVGVLASTMIVAQMGLLAALVKYTWQAQKQETTVSPASGDVKLKDMVLFSVMVKDAAKVQDMRALLEGMQAQVISGPSAIGIWVIAVPKDKLIDAAKAFKSSAIVESADQQ
jgi:hypothetical protein